MIRRASSPDARSIAEIGVLGWQAAYRGILPDEYLDRLSVDARETAWQMVLEHETSGDTPAWVAQLDGLAIGFLHGGPPRDQDVALPAVEIYAIYVLPDHWRAGAGRALMETALFHWRGRGATVFVLWVLDANATGRSFYEALGWLPDGTRQELEIGGLATTEVRYRLVIAD